MEDQIKDLKVKLYDANEQLQQLDKALQEGKKAIDALCLGIAEKLEITAEELMEEGTVEGVVKALEKLVLIKED